MGSRPTFTFNSLIMFLTIVCQFSASAQDLNTVPRVACASVLAKWNDDYALHFKSKLKEAFERWRLERVKVMEEVKAAGLIPSDGLRIEVNGNQLPVLFLLGKGNDGTAFLVNRNGNQVVVKIFESERKMSRNLEAIRKASPSIKLPKVLEVDPHQLIVVFEYLEGVPYEYLVKHKLLSSDEFKHLWSGIDAYNLQNSFQHNIIIDAETGAMALFDPY